MFFESKEVKDFKATHVDDSIAAQGLISDFRITQELVKDHDELLVNVQHIKEVRRILLDAGEKNVPLFIDTMTFLFIRYIAKSSIPELQKDPEGANKNPNSLQTIRRQCDLVLELISRKGDIVGIIFEMKKTGKWPESFNGTNWLGEFKKPDNFLKWTVSKTTSGNPKLIFASAKVVAKIGSLFRLIDALSKLD